MKRALCVLLALSMLVLLVGCSVTTETENEQSATEAGASANAVTEEVEDEEIVAEDSEASTDEVENISYADIIPDPEEYFVDGKVSVLDSDGGAMYMLYITDYQDGEYEAYVEACQTMGFTEISYELDSEGGKMYGAYTEDGAYFLDISLGYDIEAITITCQSVS